MEVPDQEGGDSGFLNELETLVAQSLFSSAASEVNEVGEEEEGCETAEERDGQLQIPAAQPFNRRLLDRGTVSYPVPDFFSPGSFFLQKDEGAQRSLFTEEYIQEVLYGPCLSDATSRASKEKE